MAHVNILDKVRVESRLLDYPVVLACRDDAVVEVYVVDDSGLESFAGHLELLGENQAKFDVLTGAIKRRIREKPVSLRSLIWLSALQAAGLLK